jgi:hypothetical protein
LQRSKATERSVRHGRSTEIGAAKVADFGPAPLGKALLDATRVVQRPSLPCSEEETLAEQASAYNELF